eukprot:CAMPEP_0167769664 /NCGR_PEP_ID=MMETSP0110_2-20121227/17449_1 /TAXON_ID=629695 /ORGANISM="Gymnochlora sp., Strain CCMP2014" /LENGTH=415 /DNA_ID=CAMNT_0007658675 /DNA_START=174 /DNA_END=1417 /DNA_ORIENTATION=-
MRDEYNIASLPDGEREEAILELAEATRNNTRSSERRKDKILQGLSKLQNEDRENLVNYEEVEIPGMGSAKTAKVDEKEIKSLFDEARSIKRNYGSRKGRGQGSSRHGRSRNHRYDRRNSDRRGDSRRGDGRRGDGRRDDDRRGDDNRGPFGAIHKVKPTGGAVKAEPRTGDNAETFNPKSFDPSANTMGLGSGMSGGSFNSKPFDYSVNTMGLGSGMSGGSMGRVITGGQQMGTRRSMPGDDMIGSTGVVPNVGSMSGTGMTANKRGIPNPGPMLGRGPTIVENAVVLNTHRGNMSRGGTGRGGMKVETMNLRGLNRGAMNRGIGRGGNFGAGNFRGGMMGGRGSSHGIGRGFLSQPFGRGIPGNLGNMKPMGGRGRGQFRGGMMGMRSNLGGSNSGRGGGGIANQQVSGNAQGW